MDHPNPKMTTMTQIRREVSLDSQGPITAGGGSLANSRLTLESSRGETPLSVKSSFDLVDESVQVDLSADTITYDSDDEMVKKRVSLILHKNKKGHPIYSREDIREQYCINRKEVEALESGRTIKFLGCFANQHDKSPCSKNSILFSCIHRSKRSNSDENVYVQAKTEDNTAAATPIPYDTERTVEDDPKTTYDDRSTDDEEYVLSGYRKRHRNVCQQQDPNRSRSNFADSDSMSGDIASRKRKLEGSASFGSTSQQSYDELDRGYARNLQRPSDLVIGMRSKNEHFQPSRSVDELNDAAMARRSETVVPPRTAKTPDLLEDRRTKHVSFDNGSLIRSNTVGAGLEDVVYVTHVDPGPAATSTPLNSYLRRTFSPPLTDAPQRHRSKERLLDRSLRYFGDVSDERVLSVSSSTMTNIAIKPDQSLSYRMPSSQHRSRRAVMKTQATQTELTFKDRFTLPAYLTLSPRAHKTSATQAYMPNYHPQRHRSRASQRAKSASKLSKSKSAYEALGSGDDTEDDVMEVDLSGKHHTLLRASTTRASIRRQRAFDSSQEEIMVSFKPAQSPTLPRRPIEVLLGERPVPRLADRERRRETAAQRERPQTLDSKRESTRSSNVAVATPFVQAQQAKNSHIVEKKAMSTTTLPFSCVQKEGVVKATLVRKLSMPDETRKLEEIRKQIVEPVKSISSEAKQSMDDVSDLSGFRSPSARTTSFKPELDTMESSSVKSSNESVRQERTHLADSKSLTEISPCSEGALSVEELANRSDDSVTVTTTESPSPDALKAQELYQEKKKHFMTKYHQHVKDVQVESPTSPDSESSSSLFTERETSRSEVSTSSSNNNKAANKSDSESSEYVTAPDYSHRESSTPKKKTSEDHPTSFESFSSPSSRSSLHPPLARLQRSSTSPPSSASLLPLDDDNEGSPERQGSTEFNDNDGLSPPALPPLPPPLYEGEDHLESSDESTKKDISVTDDGDVPDWRFKVTTDGTSGTPDSDRTSDITPVFDASPEPLSSLQEDGVETVIEVRNSETAQTSDDGGSFSPAFIGNSLSNNGEGHPKPRTESESSESSSVLSGLQDLEATSRSGVDSGGNQFLQDHKTAEDLSTVSEVSEESSQADLSTSKKHTHRKISDVSSPSDNLLTGETGKKSSSSDYIPSEATTSSFDSTTSGSFVLENGSCNTSSSNTNNTHTSGKSSSECSSKKYGKERSKSESSRKTLDTGSESLRSPEDVQTSNNEEQDERHTPVEEKPIVSSSGMKSRIKNGVTHLKEISAGVAETEKGTVPEKSRKTSSSASSATSEHSEKFPTPSSTTPFSSSSSSLVHEYHIEDQQTRTRPERPSRSRSVEEPQHSLSAWCSEGAIPKQKIHDGGGEPRRRRDRVRMRSESREHTPSLQIAPPEYQQHYHHPRSKSHSPEKSDEDEVESTAMGGPPSRVSSSSKRVLCSQCGDKIKDHGVHHSAPPPPPQPSMWERQYQRTFWEPTAPTHHHNHHYHHHQNMGWRQKQRSSAATAGPRYSGYGGPIPRSWSTECGPASELDLYPDEDEDAGIHSESYRTMTWIYVSESDELAVWKRPVEKPERTEEEEVDPSCTLPSTSARRVIPQLNRSDSLESTSSEHEFLRQYQAVTHRMVHRKSSVEMYNRMASRTFEVDKRVVVQRNNGEFGFRIHGSKPVVVSAIEKGTPAETCGLEVGDIIVCINGLNVLDASHSEVVRIAHTGTEVLMMEVTRTCHLLAPMLNQALPISVFSGFLQRLSARSVTGRRWCRRWFIVREEGVLYWFRTIKDHEPLGALVLQNQSISRVPEAGSPHAFKVCRFGGCPHYFSADDEETASRWISALNQVASNASRSDPYMETSVRNAQLPISSVGHPDCQGFLAKLSQRWKNWRRRYFLLKDAALYFYVDHNAKVALGLFHLHGYKVQSCSFQGKKNTFEAIPPEPRLKHLYFQADSENEKKKWLAALEYSIDRWIKVG